MDSFLRNSVESVLTLKIGLQPLEILLKIWNDVLESLLVSDLVIEDEFNVWKKWQCDTERIVRVDYGFICDDVILFSNPSILFLTSIKIIHHRIRTVNLIRIDQEKRRKADIIQRNNVTSSVREVTFGELAVLLPFLPDFFQPNPGSVVHVDKILIIKMNSRYAFLNHFFTTIQCRFSTFWALYTVL